MCHRYLLPNGSYDDVLEQVEGLLIVFGQIPKEVVVGDQLGVIEM